MKRADKKILQQFQCEFTRAAEEDFARTLAERADVRLFFINENQSFTDGRNIVVDPACNELFADTRALRQVEAHLHLESRVSADRWLALRMVTRALTIHEALHLVYSNFPGGAASDPRATTPLRRLVLSLIANIIEDAFIEAAACSVYDNLEPHLLWLRWAICCSNIPARGTVEQAFQRLGADRPVPDNAGGAPRAETSSQELPAAIAALPQPAEQPEPDPRLPLLTAYLDYMSCFLLYPMVRPDDPPLELRSYIAATQLLFVDGSLCGVAGRRYSFTQRIFDLIEPLIPAVGNIDTARLARMLGGMKTHSGEGLSVAQTASQGRDARITRGLFFDGQGEPVDGNGLNGRLARDWKRFADDKEAALRIVGYQGSRSSCAGKDFDCARLHHGITIEVNRPKINLNLKKAYQNIYNKYRINITSYNARFSRLLHGDVDVCEERQLFGGGIVSRHLADVKKRYWQRTVRGEGVPQLAIMLLIDGSGSMAGALREGAIVASVILHEVLGKNGVEHAIVEHRAIYGEARVTHNVLVDFHPRAEEKYNLLTLQADEGSREGLTLYWAERYLAEKSFAEHKVIIMLSDGVPAHNAGPEDNYQAPVSTQDTRNAARKIINRGTDIVAIALDQDGGDTCYQALREIYPSLISCTDIKRLTGQLLTVVTRLLR